MSTPSGKMQAFVLAGAVAAAVCACKDHAGAEPSGASAVGSAAAPAVWEPIDRSFKGCEGG